MRQRFLLGSYEGGNVLTWGVWQTFQPQQVARIGRSENRNAEECGWRPGNLSGNFHRKWEALGHCQGQGCRDVANQLPQQKVDWWQRVLVQSCGRCSESGKKTPWQAVSAAVQVAFWQCLRGPGMQGSRRGSGKQNSQCWTGCWSSSGLVPQAEHTLPVRVYPLGLLRSTNKTPSPRWHAPWCGWRGSEGVPGADSPFVSRWLFGSRLDAFLHTAALAFSACGKLIAALPSCHFEGVVLYRYRSLPKDYRGLYKVCYTDTVYTFF